MKDTVMKATHDLRSKLNAMHQSKCIQPVLVTLALLVSVVGCNGSRESDAYNSGSNHSGSRDSESHSGESHHDGESHDSSHRGNHRK